MDTYERLKKLGIELTEPSTPGGVYSPVVITENHFVFVSGNGCALNGKPVAVGKVGKDVSLEQAQDAARVCAINILKNLQKALGDLNKIKRVVKMLAFVASDPEFLLQPAVANAASILMAEVFGEENGKGTRSAVGVAALPQNIPVEIEMVFELKD